jgi:hypothetical protein
MVGERAWEIARKVFAFLTINYCIVIGILMAGGMDIVLHARILSLLIVLQAVFYVMQMFTCEVATLSLRGIAGGKEGKAWSVIVLCSTILVSAWIFTGKVYFVIAGLCLLILGSIFSIIINLYAQRVFREYMRGVSRKLKRYFANSMPMPPLSNTIRTSRPVPMAHRINESGYRHYRKG